MNEHKNIFSQILWVFAGILICSALMVGVFALLGYFDRSVLLGALAGSIIATANHAILVLGVMIASEKAEKQ